MGVVYYENTSIPISLVLIFLLLKFRKGPSTGKAFVVLLLFITLIYLKESYILLFLTAMPVGFMYVRSRHAAVYRFVAFGAALSVSIYFILYYSLSYRKSTDFYTDMEQVGILVNIMNMITTNPVFIFTLIAMLTAAALGKTRYSISGIVAISVVVLCMFFLFTGMHLMNYRLSVAYPFLFFVAQKELLAGLQNLNSTSRVVMVVALVLVSAYNVFPMIRTVRSVMVSRNGHHESLRYVNQWFDQNGAAQYIAKSEQWEYHKLKLDVHRQFAVEDSSLNPIVPVERENLESVVSSACGRVVVYVRSDANESYDSLDEYVDSVVQFPQFEYSALLLTEVP
ncbi:MAG: hypothetical protein H6603_08120 [Flavobacteriales bacterium]|nr:hypothetical protein [Flavobacteriales bacterium]